jgi:hypothetical protein
MLAAGAGRRDEDGVRTAVIMRGDKGSVGLRFLRSGGATAGPYEVTFLVPQGAAERSRVVEVGNHFRAVNGHDVTALDDTAVAGLCRGAPGTTLTLLLCAGPADISEAWKTSFLEELCRRPAWMTEVRRDGKDNATIAKVIKAEFENRCEGVDRSTKKKLIRRMEEFANACWMTCEAMHQLMLDDEQPENEKARLDPDHWYENNLSNASLFANLTLDGLDQLVPGRLFTTRMPRDIVTDLGEKTDFVHKCTVNNLRVICVLTEQEEFKKYSGMDGLLDFYREECGLIVYNRAIPDFQIPTSGDLVNNILDLTYHLSKGRNCLVHCAGGTGRTGMVIAAIVKNLGVYDPVARIRRVKSTYVETYDQELFLKNIPKAIDSRIVRDKPLLAKAIAANHLIQVFFTHGEKLETTEDAVEKLEHKERSHLYEAYCQTFDLVDEDKSGFLEKNEVEEWMQMVGSEIDTSKITDVLLKERNLSREKFAELMSASAASNRRHYDIGGSSGGHHE